MSVTESSMENVSTKLTIQSQIDRLIKSKNCLRKRDIEIQISYGNSFVGQEVEALRRKIGEQWSIIDDFKVGNYVKEFYEIINENRRDVKFNQLHRERKILTDQLEELKNALYVAMQTKNELSQKRKLAKMERSVLEHLIKSTNNNNSQSNKSKNV